MKPKSVAYWMSFLLLSGAGCREVELPVDEAAPGFEPVVRAAKAPPIMGGTMLVTHDGAYAVISDPPRDVIHVVDLRSWKETGTIVLDDGALPFRGVEGPDGEVHITLRGPGSLITIDPASASITQNTSVCPNPRGVAFDETTGDRHVACAGGILLTLPASGGAPTRRFIAPDLRDIFVTQGRLFVTRFRAAQILEVEDDGSWALAAEPVSLVTGETPREPTTAWRTLPFPAGGWVMLHQTASMDPVPEFDEPGPVDDEFDASGYGGSRGDPCSSVVNPTLSMAYDDGIVRNSGALRGFALAVDAALSPDGNYVAVAVPSQQDASDPEERDISVFVTRLSMFSASPDQRCRRPEPLDLDDDIVAVAYQPDGALLAQARDEPILYRVAGTKEERLVLSGPSAADTGFELFHNDAGKGVSCASCHPEGGEDGRTWVFADLGPRRTQALNVGLKDTEPFHWKGDMDDIHMIARQVRQGAMGGIEQSEERQEALAEWLFSLRPPNPIRQGSDGDATDGAQLFRTLGCASCHAGESFTSPASADLGHGPLQTPALRGVALRPPYMHDGRATTLEAAILDMTNSTAPGTELDDTQVASLVAYLESL